MRNPNLLRLPLLAALLGAALAAHAVNLTLVSAGSFDLTDPLHMVFTESVVFQSHPGLAALATYVETDDYVENTFLVTYAGVNPADSLTLSLDFAGVVGAGDPNNPDVYSVVTDWTYVGGTGSYANLAGDGTYAQSGNYGDSSSTTSIKGHLQAVPEPASFAALGLAALALLRRRRA